MACPNSGYSTPIPERVGFGGLMYEDAVLGNKNMSIDPFADYHSDDPNHLIFGQKYHPVFNPALKGSDPVMSGDLKITKVSSGGDVFTPCPAATELNVSSSLVNPYLPNPEIKVDFTTEADQDPWFQVAAGGIGATTSILDNVPLTCANDARPTPCIPAMSIGNTTGTNGLVAAPVVRNDSGCGSLCKYGYTNDWGLQTNLIGERYDYNYFVNNYFNKLTVGKKLSSGNWSSVRSGLGTEKIGYINGDLTIDEDIVVPNPGFLMIVVSGKITVNSSVNQIDGIFSADLGFEAAGNSATQLVINGAIYSFGGDIKLLRGYTDGAMNNVSPAILVNYRPDMMFNLPSTLTKTLSNWREGR